MTCLQLLVEPSDLQIAFLSILFLCHPRPLIPLIPNPELKTGNGSSSVVSPLYRVWALQLWTYHCSSKTLISGSLLVLTLRTR